MKLLLTSAGITNPSIAKALFELVGKRPEETSLVFIPTASNVEVGDKGWLIDDLVNLKKLNLKSIDIADISAVGPEIWKPKFEAADVLFFEGGNSYHLMRWIEKSGLNLILPILLKNKVYVGLSAGSMVASIDLAIKLSQIVYEEDLNETENMAGLGLVDFYFLPHLNSPYFRNLREDFIRKATEGMSKTIYAMDDDSALEIIDGAVAVVSEGKWFAING
jgi:dipeptidase E